MYEPMSEEIINLHLITCNLDISVVGFDCMLIVPNLQLKAEIIRFRSSWMFTSRPAGCLVS